MNTTPDLLLPGHTGTFTQPSGTAYKTPRELAEEAVTSGELATWVQGVTSDNPIGGVLREELIEHVAVAIQQARDDVFNETMWIVGAYVQAMDSVVARVRIRYPRFVHAYVDCRSLLAKLRGEILFRRSEWKWPAQAEERGRT